MSLCEGNSECVEHRTWFSTPGWISHKADNRIVKQDSRGARVLDAGSLVSSTQPPCTWICCRDMSGDFGLGLALAHKKTGCLRGRAVSKKCDSRLYGRFGLDLMVQVRMRHFPLLFRSSGIENEDFTWTILRDCVLSYAFHSRR